MHVEDLKITNRINVVQIDFFYNHAIQKQMRHWILVAYETSADANAEN